MFRAIILSAMLLSLTACADSGPATPQQDNTSALMLLGFMNGYNQQPAQPVVASSCTTLGRTTNCISY